MEKQPQLYTSVFNPLLIQPQRPLPQAAAIIGAGTIGPDIERFEEVARVRVPYEKSPRLAAETKPSIAR